MILTESDIAVYAPSVALSGNALLGAIINTQAQIESVKGANRPLEITQFTEQKKLNSKLQNAYLSYYPLVIDGDHPIVVKARIGGEVNTFGYGTSPQEWQELDPSEYTLDIPLGRININFNSIYSRFNWWGYVGLQTQSFYTEIEIIYYSGFDFTDDANPDVLFLKTMAGQVLTFLQSPSYQGVKKLTVPFREFDIEYNNSMVGEIPQSLLLPFKRFAPVII